MLKADVDIINLNEASTVFKAQIFSSGILIYSEDDTFFMNSACWH
nr:nucleotidyltransferase domain-containing protein [Gracilibacillus timonensis]